MKPIWQYTTGAGRDSSLSRHVARPDSPAAICGYRPFAWSGLAEDDDPHKCRNCRRALSNKKYMTRLFGSALEAQ